MQNNSDLSRPFGNVILDSLTQDEAAYLVPHLKLVHLEQNEILVKLREPIQFVYFPTTALVSWVHSTINGETVEVGATGFEGMVGTPLVLGQKVAPWEVDVIIAGKAYQMSTDAFLKYLYLCSNLHRKTIEFTYLKIVQLTQSALCNRFHAIEQRLCRWLLAASDRVKTDELQLTRESIATMIGANRPAVSIVTGTLQTAGLIRTARGRVTIINREEMENSTCECYHTVKKEFDRYLNDEK
jgi:CRP-like cAMP-binding protein